VDYQRNPRTAGAGLDALDQWLQSTLERNRQLVRISVPAVLPCGVGLRELDDGEGIGYALAMPWGTRSRGFWGRDSWMARKARSGMGNVERSEAPNGQDGTPTSYPTAIVASRDRGSLSARRPKGRAPRAEGHGRKDEAGERFKQRALHGSSPTGSTSIAFRVTRKSRPRSQPGASRTATVVIVYIRPLWSMKDR